MNCCQFVAIFLILTSFAYVCMAGEFTGYFKDPDHPGKCFFGGLVLEPGKEGQIPGKCKRFLCNRADGLGVVQGCGTQGVKAPCTLGDHVNANAPYPDCCKRKVICP
ncbi:uncharacterized protein LOC131801276 [Musca domestica]|uniref:Uncharacterized protein LOC131801276 n=1 Tax=Musca domestica TaxID=7370 RepID=A0ABM3UQH6_MUSDO|nr:uncharacterized protein LOC131801276 [Musca domestica]